MSLMAQLCEAGVQEGDYVTSGPHLGVGAKWQLLRSVFQEVYSRRESTLKAEGGSL